MELSEFKNLKNEVKANNNVESFMREINNFLNKNEFINNETNFDENEITKENDTIIENNKLDVNSNRKEDHLYLVTEDRNGEVYLWDFTERAEKEFLEKDLPAEVLVFATEGAMLQYKNGEYVLYSPDGFDIVENAEENNIQEDLNEQSNKENNI